MKIAQRVSNDNEVQQHRAALVSALELYEAHHLTNSEALDPAATAERLRTKISSEPDAATRELLSARINSFTGPGAENLRTATRKIVREAFKPVREAAVVLLQAAIAKGHDLLIQAEADEAQLFELWDMPANATAISVSIKRLISELETALIAESNPGSYYGVPNPRSHRVLDMIPAPTT